MPSLFYLSSFLLSKATIMYKVMKQAQFAASHHLRNYNGKCENIHGHNWLVQVYACGDTLSEGGMLIDFSELKSSLMQVLDNLDHQDLNAVEPFTKIEPSAENIGKYIYDHMSDRINDRTDNPGVKVCEVRVWETDSSCAFYTGEQD